MLKFQSRAGVSIIVLSAFLAACGGAGGGGVAPTPAPPPAPSPSPSPSPPNTSLLILTSSESFVNDAASASATFPKTGVGQTATATTTTATIAYDLATRGYTITTGGRTQSFLPADIDNAQTTPTVTVYVKRNGTTTDSLTLTKAGTSGRFTYEFVGGGYWQRTVDGATAISGSIDAFSYGIVTPTASVPRTGNGQYAIDLIGAETIPNNVVGITGSGRMLVDFASGTVLTHGRLDNVPAQATALPQGSFSSEARLSASANSFTGNFRYSNFGEYSGQINGRFYGPTGQEVGAAFHTSGGGGNVAVGTIIGRQTALPAANTNMRALTNNQFFKNDAATLATTLQGSSGENNGTQTFSNTSATATPLIINYDAVDRAYSVVTSDRSQYFYTDNRNRGSIIETFGNPNRNSFFFANYLATTQYVLGRRWYTIENNRTLLTDITFGLETSNAALPRTGRAGYNIALIGSAADADLPNLTDFGGRGVLTADFATGAISASGNMEYREDYFIAGRAARTATGTFSLTSTLLSSANSFSGTISFNGIGNYSGPLSGRFYGPAAEEVGAAFTATDGIGGGASGILTGIKDPNITAVVPGLLDLTQTTLLKNFAVGRATSNNLSSESYVQYNPATKTYALFPVLQPTTNAADLAYRFGPSQLAVNQSNATYSVYQGTGPTGQFNVNDTFKASVFNPGATNPQLALSYTSFADLTVTDNSSSVPFTRRDFLVFGVPTPVAQVPKTGSASYSGVAFGQGNAGGTALNFDGTSSLTTNFGASSFTASVNLTARNPFANTSFILAPLSFTGTIFNSTQLSGSGVSEFSGTFFGQNAAEFGAVFSKNGTDAVLGSFSVQGVALGKKN